MNEPYDAVPIPTAAVRAPARLPGAPVARAEVRGVRDAAGWTREQLADALGVMLLEVEAWESGSIAISARQAHALGREANVLERDRRLAAAGAPPCEWMDANRPRLIGLRLAGGVPQAGAEREERMHRRDCPACLYADAMLREDPALEPPRLPGPRGWYEVWQRFLKRMPWPVRFPLRVGELAAWVALALIAVAAAHWFLGLEYEPFFPMEWFLALAAGGAGLALVEPALERMWDDHPLPTLIAKGAAIGLPAGLLAVLLNGLDLEHPVLWFAVALVVTLAIVLGMNAWEDAHPPRPRED